jgi:DNA-binding transcriptional MerR regulator
MKLRARYYTIDSAARELGLTKWMLLRLERLGHIPPARRDPQTQYRLYDDVAIERIRQAINEMRPVDTHLPG